MKNHTVKIIGVFFTLFFFHSIFCYSDEVNLEEIKKAVEKRIEAANPIYVKYTNKTTYTVDYNKYLVDNPQDVSNENITFDVIMEWAQKGDKLRFSSISPELFNGRIVEQPKENLFVFDENLVVINNGSFYFDDEQHPFYKISYDKKNTKVHLNIFDLSGDTIVRRVLSSFNSQKQSCKIEKRSDTNGSNIFLNINDSGRSEKVSVWLTDDQDHLIKKLEFISGSSKDILEDITYKVINDIPVPISGKYTRFLNGKLFEERIFNVSFIELKGNKIPNSLFTMKIPQNAVVQNMDTGQILVDTSVIKDYLDSIPLWKHPKFWFLGCINLVILGVIIYLSRNNIRLLLRMKK